MTLRVLIVGAGIAGLALARALRLRGITAEVVERTAEWEASGAGLYLPGNSVRALDELGIWEELAAPANAIVRQRFLDHRGRRLADIDVRSYWDGSRRVSRFAERRCTKPSAWGASRVLSSDLASQRQISMTTASRSGCASPTRNCASLPLLTFQTFTTRRSSSLPVSALRAAAC